MFRRLGGKRHPEDPSMDFRARRENMVRTQIVARDIRDPRVLEAMRTIPREAFVPNASERGSEMDCYADSPISIEHGQTMSQPFTVAFMAEALELQGTEKVLEIGTGSGYGAAVLSQLAHTVCSVERYADLADRARTRLARLGFTNVQVFVGDGSLGLPEEAPFDAICVTAFAQRLPNSYRQQLKDGGRIVIPVGERPRGQQMLRYRRLGNEWEVEDLGAFSFVPLVGQEGGSSGQAKQDGALS